MTVYFLGGIAGKATTFMPDDVTLLSPAFGIGLAAVLLLGRRYSIGVFFGCFLFSFSSGDGVGWEALGTAIGSSLGALLCAHLLGKVRFQCALDRIRDVAALVLVAGFIGSAVSAAFHVAGRSFAREIDSDELLQQVFLGMVPNSLGALLITSLFLAWTKGYHIAWTRRKVIEGVICAGGLSVGTLLSFKTWYAHGIIAYPLAYLPYPFLLWGSVRFGQRGATTGTFVVSILAIFALLEGRGPFVVPQRTESLLLLGAYVATLAISNLFLAAAATERERAEASLRESERRYRGIVEDQTDMIWRFREDGTVTFVNEAYCRFHGKKKEELLGVKYLPMLSDDDRNIPLSYFAALPQDNPTITYDIKLTDANGATTWQQCTTRRLFTERGATLEFQSVAQDVTRRRMMEDAARDAEQTLRAVQNALVDGLLVTDAHGRVTATNPAAEKIFGGSSAELVGREVSSLLAPSDLPAYEHYLKGPLVIGQPRVIELHALRADGSRIPVDLAANKVWLGSSSLSIIVIRDISERRHLEEQIRQTQKMEAVGRLAGGVAHDFNNLLQGISGYTSVLLTSGNLTEQQVDMLAQIDKSADRGSALTRQLLAFSRQQPLEPRTFSLPAVAHDLEHLLRRLIGQNIHLITRYAPRGTTVRSDPGQMEQVILNLAINARDAMPHGGTLTIAVTPVKLEERREGFSAEFKPGIYVLLAVSDTGSGMSPEVRARLFEPFFTTKAVGKGTGLGLSIVYGIIKQSGGEIAVQSAPGKGATFEIYLPQHPDAVVPMDNKPPQSMPSSAGETILFVEDNEVIRSLFVQVLTAHGYTVVQASDGADALNRTSGLLCGIDLLVTDLSMPNMDGRTLDRNLRARYPALRSLFISGYAEEEMSNPNSALSAGNFLQKPFKPDALLRRVREILDQPLIGK